MNLAREMTELSKLIKDGVLVVNYDYVEVILTTCRGRIKDAQRAVFLASRLTYREGLNGVVLVDDDADPAFTQEQTAGFRFMLKLGAESMKRDLARED